MQLGQYPAPSHVVAHLSDVHLLADGALQYGVVDPEPGLVRALDRLRAVSPAPQALVFTGDLADRAEPAAYRRLRELVEPFAAEIGAVVVWVMGNHDERPEYAAELFGVTGAEAKRPQDRCYDVAGLRIIALDSSVPGYHHGDLTTDQLTWLAEQLATPAEHGTLLALHHPPVPLPMLPAAELIELADQHLLAEVVEGTDVRAILGGHLHFSTYSTLAGVPVSVASASCYTTDPAPVGRFVSGVDGHQSLTMVHLYAPPHADRVVHTIVPLAEAPEVSGYPDDVMAQLEAFTPAQLREEISRKDSAFNTRS